jgi:hypothetical protein
MGVYTRAVSRQRLRKNVPTASNRLATEELLETGFSTQSVPRSYKEDNWADQVSSVWESVMKGLEGEKMKNIY